MSVNGKDKQDVFDEYFNSENAVIIDGVDVSDCAYFDYENDGYKDSCYIHDNECSAQFCYYKQLMQLKAENEKLKKEVSDLNFYIDNYKITWEIDKKEQYKQALEEIRGIAKSIYQICDDECGNASRIRLITDKINEVLK